MQYQYTEYKTDSYLVLYTP